MGVAQTETAPRRPHNLMVRRPHRTPGLVLAWSPGDVVAADRIQVQGRLVVGRGSTVTWRIQDDLMSREHFELIRSPKRLMIRDLGSRNGTFLDGERVNLPQIVNPGAVIRAGRCVCVVVEDISGVAKPQAEGFTGLAGRFHSPTHVHVLKVASYTGRHVLLDGESGSGKEIAARILHHYYRGAGRAGPFIAQNGARFASEEDAVASFFGVARGGFTGVKKRRGAIESADQGTLFLDEVHNLPLRVQRSLLRFVEDGVIQRVGGSTKSRVDVCIIFGTNHPVTDALDEGLLAQDLITRLHRVSLLPLRQRRADIPDIFLEVLRKSGAPEIVRVIEEALDEELMELLVTNRYHRGNVRELEDLASLLVAKVLEGERPWLAMAEALSSTDIVPLMEEPSLSSDSMVPYGSSYDVHRQEIIDTYYRVDGNLTKLESLLREKGISCSRRWLATYLECWGVRRVKRR